MTGVAHTPGPWQIKHIDISAGYSNRSDRRLYIESVPLKKKGFVGNIISVRDKADASLIAAAPELLEACIEMAGFFEDDTDVSSRSPLANACAAIAKAKGESL